MYAPIFPSWYIKEERWHLVSPYDHKHPVCNRRYVLDHERTREDLPEGAAYCQQCAARERFGKPNAETVAAMKESDAGGGEVFTGSVEDAIADVLGRPS